MSKRIKQVTTLENQPKSKIYHGTANLANKMDIQFLCEQQMANTKTRKKSSSQAIELAWKIYNIGRPRKKLKTGPPTKNPMQRFFRWPNKPARKM